MWSINVHLRLLKATIEFVCVNIAVAVVVVGIDVVVIVVVLALLVVTDHIILSCGQ